MDQPAAAFWVCSFHAQASAPPSNGLDVNAPPKPNGKGGFVADGSGKPFIDQDAGAAARAADSDATRPGDPCCGPAGDYNVAIAGKAERPAATLQPRWMIRPKQKFDALALVHVVVSV